MSEEQAACKVANKEYEASWALQLKHVAFVRNTTVASHGFTPFEVLLGTKARLGAGSLMIRQQDLDDMCTEADFEKKYPELYSSLLAQEDKAFEAAR